MNKELNKHFQNIIDAMSGGARFVKFMSALKVLDQEAKDGSGSAQLMLGIVHQFSHLINITVGKSKDK